MWRGAEIRAHAARRFDDANRANHICTFDRSEAAVWLQTEASTTPTARSPHSRPRCIHRSLNSSRRFPQTAFAIPRSSCSNASVNASSSSDVIPISLPSACQALTAFSTSRTMVRAFVSGIRKYSATDRSASIDAAGPVSSEIQVFNSRARSGNGLTSKAGDRRHVPRST